jgi:TonB family protein
MMNFLTHIPNVRKSMVLKSAPTRRIFGRRTVMVFLFAIPLAICPATRAQELQPQEPTPTQPAAQQPAPPVPQQPAQPPSAPMPTPAPTANPGETAASTTSILLTAPPTEPPIPGDFTEDMLKQMLVGKQLFLRGSYLDDSLSFNEYGDPVGQPKIGSFTLSAIQIDQVHLSKNRLELEGNRYAVHFLGGMPYQEDAKALDRVKITPKKKALRISIERENLDKHSDESNSLKAAIAKQAAQNAATAATTTQAATENPAPQPDAKPNKKHGKDKDKPSEVATAAHSAKVLHDALDKIFAQGIDDKFRAKLPEYWQLYFNAQAAGVDFPPVDPGVFRPSGVDTQAKVLTPIAPQSNEYAQNNGIVGRAIYRVVVGTDGSPREIAVVRPIGFGLDENAVAAIEKASFSPAAKAGKPVPEAVELAVLFRIYSKRTAEEPSAAPSSTPAKVGPYSAGQPPPQ